MVGIGITAREDAIKRKIALSELIGVQVKLTSIGREWKGLCPFHSEKTASFTVNNDKGFYHCFGCGAHGDAIDWLTIREGLSRYLALEKLSRMAGATQASGGGKLNRSETVTVRLDPKLNYLCELSARAQRRTKSSFIEWAVAESLASSYVPTEDDRDSGFNISIKQLAGQLWHVDEADRTVALALVAPTLLNHEEQLTWRLIRENGYIWRGSYNRQGDWSWTLDESSLIRERLRENWGDFKAVAAGELSESHLPKWSKRRESALDDDLPF